MTFFTPWLFGALVANTTFVVLYITIGRNLDPVGWGFVLVAVVTAQMLASVGTEIVFEIRSLKR